MTLTLYLAPLLTVNSRHIFHDIGKYLGSCTSKSYAIKKITCRDILSLHVLHDDVSEVATYAVLSEGSMTHHYKVISTELATTGCVLLTLERDYLGEFFSGELNHNRIRVNGLFTGGHLLLSDTDRAHLAYELPVPQGDITHIKRNVGLYKNGKNGWGVFGLCGFAIRAVLNSDELAGSKTVLLRSRTYEFLSTELLIELSNVINSAKSVTWGDNAYGIEEITDIWVVPEGFLPALNTDYEGIPPLRIHLGGSNYVDSFGLGAPTEAVDVSVWEVNNPPYNRTFVGNNVTNIEIPANVRNTKVTCVSYWGVDYRLYASLRCCGKYVDIGSSFRLGDNLYSNSANSLTGKISTGVGVLTSALSIGVGAFTGNPVAIAGGVSGMATTIGGAVGAVTTSAANGASGLQSLYTETVSLAEKIGDNTYATSVPGGLSITWYELTNSSNIADTINLYGVNCNVAITDRLTSFIQNNFQFIRFDNVDIESTAGGSAPPQFYKALQSALENGVWLWANSLQTPSPEMAWDGDYHYDY